MYFFVVLAWWMASATSPSLVLDNIKDAERIMYDVWSVLAKLRQSQSDFDACQTRQSGFCIVDKGWGKKFSG
jgi:hypothetical protein